MTPNLFTTTRSAGLVITTCTEEENAMMIEPTKERLYAMRLAAMAIAWQEQQKDPRASSLSFDERFALVVEAEYVARDNRRLTRLLKDAQLRLPEACLEDVEISSARGIEKAQLAQLATCAWIGDHLNVLISGPTGVGKSFVACALGQMACRRGFRVLYRRMPRLFEELSLAKADGSYARVLGKLARFDLVILDDLGIGSLKEAQRHDLLEVFEDRYASRSTVITSQLPVNKWHEWIGDPTLADAILDRLVHKAHKISMKGPSRRKEAN
jgi:DNA replication protein DnaC